MTDTGPESPANDLAPAVLEREMQLVREAIEMVATGAAPRVTVAGIRFGDNILEPAREWAVAAGVRIAPLWRTDEQGVDIAVEPGEANAPGDAQAPGDPEPARG
jgi:hypothetical protein